MDLGLLEIRDVYSHAMVFLYLPVRGITYAGDSKSDVNSGPLLP
jgi:hypothetical protein